VGAMRPAVHGEDPVIATILEPVGAVAHRFTATASSMCPNARSAGSV
jgi:hypothetical protein